MLPEQLMRDPAEPAAEFFVPHSLLVGMHACPGPDGEVGV